MCSFQSSHLLGHFTSNCCGCLDTRLMMQPGLEIILMSLLIRKNSKIANFHCPHNTKYTQKISIHSDSVGQKYLSRLIIKILFPNSQKPRKHIYNKIYTGFPIIVTPQLLDPVMRVGQDKCSDTQVSGVFYQEAGVRWVRWPPVFLLIIMTLCNTPGPLSSQVSRRVTGQPPL